MWSANSPTCAGLYWVRRANSLVRGVAMAEVDTFPDRVVRASCHWWGDPTPVDELRGLFWLGPIREGAPEQRCASPEGSRSQGRHEAGTRQRVAPEVSGG